MTESHANTISARGSTTEAQTNRCVAAAEQLGFTGLRANAVFEEYFPTTSTTDYTGINRLVDAVIESSRLDSLCFSVGPYPSTADASWATLLGTYGSANRLVKKRPPAGTANAGWQKLTDCVNALIAHTKTRWVNGGKDPQKLYWQIFQEPGIGGSDGPTTSDIVAGGTSLGNAHADAVAAGIEGYWDRDGDWSTVKDFTSVNGYSNVRGVQDFMEFMYPQLDLQGTRWLFPAFEAQSTALFLTECQTAFPSSSPLVTAMFAESGVIEFDIHCYYGSIATTWPRNADEYAILSLNKLWTDRLALIDQLTAVDWDPDGTYNGLVKWHCTECGFKASYLYGTDVDSPTWTHQGRGVVWRQLISFMRYSGFEGVHFEELHADPVTGGDDFFLMDTSGNPSIAAKGIAQAHGIHLDVTGAVPWDGATSWRTNSVEVPL